MECSTPPASVASDERWSDPEVSHRGTVEDESMTEVLNTGQRSDRRKGTQNDTLAQIEAEVRASNEEQFSIQVRNIVAAIDKAKEQRNRKK